MRRARPWLVAAGLVVVLVAGLLVALPAVVRWAVVRQVSAMTGQDAAIADVDLNLFTRHLVIRDFRVGAGGEDPPVARFARLEATFRLSALLHGVLDLERAVLSEPVVHVVRRDDGDLNVTPMIEHMRRRPASEGPPAVRADLFVVKDGAALFEDRRVDPARTWRASAIALEARDLTPVGEPAGTAEARLVVAGAPATLRAEDIGLHPLQARVAIALDGLDLEPIGAYLPPDAAFRVQGGRVTARHEVRYHARDGVHASGSVTVADLVVARRGQDVPFLTAPLVTLDSKNVVSRDGHSGADRLELTAQPTIVDASVEPAARYAVQTFHLQAAGVGYPTPDPGRVTLDAALAGGGTLRARGTVVLAPVSLDGTVEIAGLDVGLASPYLPRDAALTVEQGRLAATIDVRYADPSGVTASGAVRVADLTVGRRGQAEPLISHARLTATVTGLALDDGRLAVQRAELTGAPTIIDGSVSPPQRFDVASLSLSAEEITWPSRRPAGVQGSATLSRGGTASIAGAVDLATLAADVRATVDGIDVTRLAGYLPADSPIAPTGGVASARLSLIHARGAGVTIDGDVAVENAAVRLTRAGDRVVTAPEVTLSIGDLLVGDGGVTADRLLLEAAPTLLDTAGPRPRSVAFRGVRVVVNDAAWPGGGAAVSLDAELPGAGTLTTRGRMDLGGRAFELDVVLREAALAPWAPLIAPEAPVDGQLAGTFTVAGTVSPLQVTVNGDMAARDVAIGAGETAPITVAEVVVPGIDVRWPERVQIDRIVVRQPRVLVVREADGDFPLVAMLRPEGDAAPSASPPTDGPAPTRPAGDRDEPPLGIPFAIGRILVEDGQARFVDRATRPFYSEELSNLTVAVTDLTSGKGSRAEIDIQGILGADAALRLEGVVAPFGRPFFLEVTGELRDFAVPRTNPYLRRFLAWIARSGELTTRLHYRIVGEDLHGTNQIVVQQLDVERADDDEVGRALGLPLALIVSLLKNPQGDIRLSIPVEGELGSPQFSFGDAIMTALKNTVSRVVTAPLRAIGRVFRGDDDGEIEAVEVDPLTFEPGSAVVTPSGARHLQQVADFLRASPYVRLALQPVVTEGDLRAMERAAAVARIQQYQRERGLGDLATAAARLFRERYPRRAAPERTEAIVAALAEGQAVGPEAISRLARQRADAASSALVETAGIEPDRLVSREAPPPGAPGEPRLEFEIRPAS
jgi:hypothetical protein